MPGTQHETFGARLRRYREAVGFTQEELAQRAGLSANAVGQLERGVRQRPYPHTVRSLADAMELSEGERASLLASVPRSKPGGLRATPSTATSVPGLPVLPTSLVGRAQDVAMVRSLLEEDGTRLVT